MSDIQDCLFETDVLVVIRVIELTSKGSLKLHLLGG